MTVHATVTGVSKRFGEMLALREAGLELRSGEIHALVGGNGSGKSTLIKILAGVETADAGSLEIGERTYDLSNFSPADARASGLHFVHQERTTFGSMSVAENLAIGRGFEAFGHVHVRRGAVAERADEVLGRFHIDAGPDDQLGALRPSAQAMVAIARALQDQDETDSGVLVLDEPTAALPPADVELLLDALNRYASAGQSILFVSHRLDEVLAVADRITVLRDGQRVASVARKEVDQDELVRLIVGKPVEAYFPDSADSNGSSIRLEARGLTGGIVRDASFTLRSGEMVGVTGLSGSGCSTLLRLIFGAQPIDSGELLIDGGRVSFRNSRDAMRAGVAYVPPDRAMQALFPDHSCVENMTVATLGRYWRGGALRKSAERSDAREDMHRYEVRAPSDDIPVSHLSGGNQQKVVLARWLRRDPSLCLLDEPTQGVDVGARAELWRLVQSAVDAGAATLVASSDVEELAGACSRVLVLRDGRIAECIEGRDVTPHRIVERLHAVDANTTNGAAA